MIIVVNEKRYDVVDELAEDLKAMQLAQDVEVKTTEKVADKVADKVATAPATVPQKTATDADADAPKTAAAADAETKVFDVEIGGTKMTLDAAALAYITEKAKDAEAKPAVDTMEAVRVSNMATKVLGAEFDFNACDSLDTVKRKVVTGVFGKVVSEDQMKAADALETLYTTACASFNAKHEQFVSDQVALTAPVVDGEPKKGMNTPSPVAHLLNIAKPATDGMVAPMQKKIEFSAQEAK